METQSDQNKFDDSVIAELMDAPKTILGYELNPITLASVALLQQLKSPLIMGQEVSSIENLILDCCIFIRIQTLPLKAATKLVFGDKDALIEAALEMAATIPPLKINEVVESIVSLLKDATSTRVSATDKNATASSTLEDAIAGNG